MRLLTLTDCGIARRRRMTRRPRILVARWQTGDSRGVHWHGVEYSLMFSRFPWGLALAFKGRWLRRVRIGRVAR